VYRRGPSLPLVVDIGERRERVVELTVCPECRQPAEVEWRAVLESTDGPVEHAKVLCVRRHWFLLPTADLARRHDTVDGGREPARPFSRRSR
jgi:uncharacterized protein YbaR (Trm112 family)